MINMLQGKSPTPLSVHPSAVTLPQMLFLFHLQYSGFYVVHSFQPHYISSDLTSFLSIIFLFLPFFDTQYPYLPYLQCLQDPPSSTSVPDHPDPKGLYILVLQTLRLQEPVN